MSRSRLFVLSIIVIAVTCGILSAEQGPSFSSLTKMEQYGIRDMVAPPPAAKRYGCYSVVNYYLCNEGYEYKGNWTYQKDMPANDYGYWKLERNHPEWQDVLLADWAQLGVNSTHLNIYPQNNSLDISPSYRKAISDFVALSRKHGIKVGIRLDALGGTEGWPMNPSNPDNMIKPYLVWVKDIATLLKGQTAYYILGDEMTIVQPTPETPDKAWTAEKYIGYFSKVSTTIKKIDPEVKVSMFAIGGGNWKHAEYLFEKGFAKYADGVANNNQNFYQVAKFMENARQTAPNLLFFSNGIGYASSLAIEPRYPIGENYFGKFFPDDVGQGEFIAKTMFAWWDLDAANAPYYIPLRNWIIDGKIYPRWFGVYGFQDFIIDGNGNMTIKRHPGWYGFQSVAHTFYNRDQFVKPPFAVTPSEQLSMFRTYTHQLNNGRELLMMLWNDDKPVKTTITIDSTAFKYPVQISTFNYHKWSDIPYEITEDRKTLMQLEVSSDPMMIRLVSLAAENIHETGNYRMKITPHPNLGKFELQHNPDQPIIASYGGIGLHLTEEGKWTSSRISEKADVDRLIQRCAENGLKRLCPNIFYQWIPSKLMSAPPDDFVDLMPYLVEQAHLNNIEVYVCIPVFSARQQEKPFVQANRDLFTKTATGQGGPLPSPAYKKVRNHRIAVILECCERYPIDGIQLDYIRWPHWPRNPNADQVHDYGVYGYDEPLLTEFRKKNNLPTDYMPALDDPRFVQAKQKYVSLFIKELRQALRDNGISLPIGVYNSSSYGRGASLRCVHQDWKFWEDKALVDEHHPMFYMDSMTRLARAIKSIIDIKRKDSTVLGALFLDGGYLPTPEMCREATRRCIKLGCDGMWICRPMEVERYGLWPVIKEISQLSISKIRAEDFDPLYENLVTNAGFESDLSDWQIRPASAATLVTETIESGKFALKINLQSDQPTELVHEMIHYNHPVCDIRSLGFAFAYKSTKIESSEPVKVQLTFKYTGDFTETKTFTIKAEQTDWQRHTIDLRFIRNNQNRVRTATISVITAAGTGSIWLDSVEMTYDPLDNPLEQG